MATGGRLDPLVTRAWRALAHLLPKALDGDVEAVHKARVATRRLREALPVLSAGDGRAARRARRRLGRLTRALGPVRELDVTLGLVADLERHEPGFGPALGLVRPRLTSARAARRQDLVARVSRRDVNHLAALLAHAAPWRPGTRSPESMAVLVTRATDRAGTLAGAIRHAGALYAPEALHGVRVATKKLRYTLELARDVRLLRSTTALRRLRAAQELLGSLHDTQVLMEHVARAQADGVDGEGGTALTDLMMRLEDDCRVRHAEYVRRRARLLEVAAAVQDRSALPAPAPPPGPPPVALSHG